LKGCGFAAQQRAEVFFFFGEVFAWREVFMFGALGESFWLGFFRGLFRFFAFGGVLGLVALERVLGFSLSEEFWVWSLWREF